jgi:hypothetical protein
MPFEPAQQVFPNARKSQGGLPDIEDNIFISEQVQIQTFPICRALFNQKEAFQ